MYLVELKPGKEELYRTGDDLAIAIRDGDVDARSRIYHRVTAKWISITLHPQYKAIIAGQEEQERVRPARKAWGLLSAAMGSVPVELPAGDAPASSNGIRQRWKRPIGLGLACILLLLGIQLAFSGPRPPWAGQGKAIVRAAPQRKSMLRVPVAANPVRDETEMGNPDDYQLDMVSLAGTHSSWAVRPTVAGDTIAVALPPVAVAVPPVAAAPALPRAPRLRSKALRAALAANAPLAPVKERSIQSLMARYEAASNEVDARLESGMRVARLNRLFAPGRLSPGGGVTDTRRQPGRSRQLHPGVPAAAGRRSTRRIRTQCHQLAKHHRWTAKRVQAVVLPAAAEGVPDAGAGQPARWSPA